MLQNRQPGVGSYGKHDGDRWGSDQALTAKGNGKASTLVTDSEGRQTA